MSDVLYTEKRGHVWLMRLNRPDKYNAFNLQLLQDLAAAYTTYEEDSDLRCAVLVAAGDNFTAGLQLDEVGPAVESGQRLFPEGHIDPIGLHEPVRRKPVICGVQGWCLTIGIELLLACDIRLAATGTRFSQLEIKRGIMPFGGATLRFPEMTGWGNAMRWLLTADEFGPEEAYRLGLVQEVVEPDQVESRCLALAETVAKQAPLAVQATIESARTAMTKGHAEALSSLMDHARSLMSSEDAKEGLQSFVERREARFQGK